MTAALLTTECESARRAANTTSAPTMTVAISQNQPDHTLEAPTMQAPTILLLPAVTLTESGPRPEPRSAMRVVYDRRRELRQVITSQGGAVCAHCDGHGWGHPAEDGELWPCYWCVDGIMPLAAAPTLVIEAAPAQENAAVIVVDSDDGSQATWNALTVEAQALLVVLSGQPGWQPVRSIADSDMRALDRRLLIFWRRDKRDARITANGLDLVKAMVSTEIVL